MKTEILALLLLGTASPLFARPDEGSGNIGYVAHEWGTFTSVQAADGVQMRWNPFTVAELPDFVYSLSAPYGKSGPQNLFGKRDYSALQRMETPVIYFYADQPQNVQVSVNFPSGSITEWYPQITRGKTDKSLESGAASGRVQWRDVQILPRTNEKPYPKEVSGSHYYAARETQANPIRIKNSGKFETEKFLFYRGVASFQAPLTVKQQSENAEVLELRNTGAEELRALFIYQIHDGRVFWNHADNLLAGGLKEIHLDESSAVSLDEFHSRITPELTQALVKEGLFEPEAKAMVKTWEDSWFNEQGTRVLYILPRSWTDRTLDLNLSPAPRDTVRVMIGRAELITPKMEFALLRHMIDFVNGDESTRKLAIEGTRKLGLGRFAEATVRHVLAGTPKTKEFNERSWELVSAASRPQPTATQPLAQN